jgi:L-cysteine desulfidase
MNKEDGILQILEKEMAPALGCTDPAGIAYAASYARKYGKGDIQSIWMELSPNIIKNASAVCIPNTNGRCGVALAAALGAIGGLEENKLEVFSGITEEHLHDALDFIAKDKVGVKVAQGEGKLFIRLHLMTSHDQIEVVIRDSYTNVVELSVNQDSCFSSHDGKSGSMLEETMPSLSLDSILSFAENISIEKLDVIRQAIDWNMAIAEEGLRNEYGISVGKKIQESMDNGILAEDLASLAMMRVAAATDARMAGLNLPVMSNTGSGNQGLASTVPVISVAERLGASPEEMVRGVTISSLVTIYIKNKLGELTAVCGATIAAAGTACGVVYLLGGREAAMLQALKSVLGNVAGMVCDGAKAGCSMKVSTCTQAALLSAMMAMAGKGIQGTDGIVDHEEGKTIDNFIRMATEGMGNMDQILLDIILDK